MNNLQLYNKLKEYILEQKEDVSNGDVEQWLYEKLLTKMNEFMAEINSESPLKTIQKIIGQYPPIDTELCEEIMRRYRNGEDMEEFIKETKEETSKRVALETNAECDDFEEQWSKDKRMSTKTDLLYDDSTYIEYMYEDAFDEMMKVGQDFRETLGISLKEQLKNALVKFSYGQLNEEKADQISEKSIDKIDLTNSVLNHKGINWWAKEILSLMGIPNNKYQTLNQIREKNRTNITLLGSETLPQEYSDELVNQCKEEFKTFVKPIKDKVISRYIKDCTNKYNRALKNLPDI